MALLYFYIPGRLFIFISYLVPFRSHVDVVVVDGRVVVVLPRVSVLNRRLSFIVRQSSFVIRRISVRVRCSSVVVCRSLSVGGRRSFVSRRTVQLPPI